MIEENVEFYSSGLRLSGILRRPDGDGPFPGIVQGPGWLGLKDAQLYQPYHQAFVDNGLAVLIFDYRGFGDSDGDRNSLSPRNQLDDLRAAASYLESRQDIESSALGAFGSGGTGGGNAVLLAALDDRIRCAVSQVPVADGRDWLKRMRREYEWQEFLQRIAEDRIRRATTGEGEMVHPREDIMVPTPERRATSVKSDVDGRIPTKVPLAAAEEIMEYRPIDAAPGCSALMVVAVENDTVTPTDHAVALYEAAPEPKQLVLQRHTTHYAAYKQYGDVVIPRMVDWFRTHLTSSAVEAHTPNGLEILREYA